VRNPTTFSDQNLYSNPAAYESYMGRWSMALAPPFLRFACSREPKFLLDVGCGTGTLIRAAAQSFPRAPLVGMDPVLAYLVHARTIVGRGRVDFVVGLVEQTPFADAAFDCCLSLLLLQEIRDRKLALSEMRRVTGQGGIVAACQWDFRHGMPMLIAIREVLNAVVPDVCEGLSKRQASAFASDMSPSCVSIGRQRVLRTLRQRVWPPPFRTQASTTSGSPCQAGRRQSQPRWPPCPPPRARRCIGG